MPFNSRDEGSKRIGRVAATARALCQALPRLSRSCCASSIICCCLLPASRSAAIRVRHTFPATSSDALEPSFLEEPETACYDAATSVCHCQALPGVIRCGEVAARGPTNVARWLTPGPERVSRFERRATAVRAPRLTLPPKPPPAAAAAAAACARTVVVTPRRIPPRGTATATPLAAAAGGAPLPPRTVTLAATIAGPIARIIGSGRRTASVQTPSLSTALRPPPLSQDPVDKVQLQLRSAIARRVPKRIPRLCLLCGWPSSVTQSRSEPGRASTERTRGGGDGRRDARRV